MSKYIVLYEKVGYIRVNATCEEEASRIAEKVVNKDGVDCEGKWDETEVIEDDI